MRGKSETDEALGELLGARCNEVFSRAGLLLRREGSRKLIWASHPLSGEPAPPADSGLQAIETSPFEGSSSQAYYVEFGKEPVGVYEFYFESQTTPLPSSGAALLMELASLAQSCFWMNCTTALLELLKAQQDTFSHSLHRGLAQELTVARLEFGLADSDPDATERIAVALKRCAEELRSLLQDKLRPKAAPQGLKLRLFEQLKSLSDLSLPASTNSPRDEILIAKRLVSPKLISVWLELDGTIEARNEVSYEFGW